MSNRIVHIVYSFGCGGLEKVIANLITYSTQYDVEHIIVSLTGDVTMREQIPLPVKVIILDKRAGNDLISHKKLYKLLKELRPKAINTYNFGTIEYHLTAKLAGVPVRVHSDHGRGGDHPQGKNQLHNLFRRFVANFITEYIVVSYDLYEWVCNSLKINNRKVTLIFNGVDIPLKPKKINKKFNTYVTVGRLDRIKNQQLMIEAFGEAINKDENFSNNVLNIVGDGPIYHQLESHIKRLGLTQSIKLLGYRDNITDILNESDVFLLSSVYEAMPMTILEAMANKTPVICTDVGGISQFISEKEAWLIESENKEEFSNQLLELVELNERIEQKINAAFDLVKNHYSVEQMVQHYLNKYQLQKLGT
ncbi:glycosyltransferase [Thalassotalea sp. SU-HH00458]|uniref:glycosyltransferase n=1 Tax=Thalassotalea sp. SU-HH00458 TaxID=3127657 RepID=UPI00310582BC